jgi:cyclase
MYYGASKLIRERAKELRLNLTAEEKMLWAYISNKQLGARFRRQHPIHTYIADFFCPELKLTIEVDGGIHLGKEQREYDSERDNILKEFGITTLRFGNDDIHKNMYEVINSITEVIKDMRMDASKR